MHSCMYERMIVNEFVYIYMCMYAFISLNITLFYLLNKTKQFTKVKRSNVHTSASTFFSNYFAKLLTLLYLQCLFDLLVDLLHD